MPRTGDRLRLRLYYDCVEAGLISRTHDEEDEDEDEDEHQNWQLMFIVFILCSMLL